MKAWRSILPMSLKVTFTPFLARITRHKSLNCCREWNALRRDVHICDLTAEMEQCIPKPDGCACHMDDLELCRALNGFLETLNGEKCGSFCAGTGIWTPFPPSPSGAPSLRAR